MAMASTSNLSNFALAKDLIKLIRRKVPSVPAPVSPLSSNNTITAQSKLSFNSNLTTWPLPKLRVVEAGRFNLGGCNHTSNFHRSALTFLARGSSEGGALRELELRCSSCSHAYSSDPRDFVQLVSCPKCKSLQELGLSKSSKGPALPNYFDILNVKRSYKVDLPGILQRCKQLQKRFHPDLYSQKSLEQQNLSQEYSSLINKALYTLSDPIGRGRYLLSLGGLDPDDPKGDLEKTMTNNPEFLEEVMELNERLVEIDTEASWTQFRNENLVTIDKIQKELEQAFDKEDLEKAQKLLGRLKYYDTIQHKLKEVQGRIGVVE